MWILRGGRGGFFEWFVFVLFAADMSCLIDMTCLAHARLRPHARARDRPKNPLKKNSPKVIPTQNFSLPLGVQKNAK